MDDEAYRRLRDLWYERLAKEGFRDIEVPGSDRLKGTFSRRIRRRLMEYYRMLEEEKHV